MLQLTKKLQEGISLVNATDISKVNGVMGRVCVALSSGRSQVFTEEEEEKLSVSLGHTRDQTRQLIHTILHIIQQVNMEYCIDKRPAVLGEHAAGITHDRVEIFTEHWTTNAKPIVDKLRQQSLSEKQLEDVGELHLQTASSCMARQSHPIAHLQLNLSSRSDAGKLASTEKVVMQFDRDQLYNLYDQLEQIQSHLDALR
ncbi:COMM domain-containing protein 10-like [Homarus americanus]|uniref:COMM domain-containing protein 10-like n=1 Tax=Homarus americanus TaxID=6706 RepID=A0A8J5K0K1_HOMAM|nr:COMM domain-containing protein 10-like [Homarus americanus]